MTQPYYPDPDDSDLVFNIPKGSDEKNESEDEAVSDSDEAPDDVPFSKSKNDALSLRNAEELVQKSTKEQQKKRRQQNEVLLKEQKEDKIKRLKALASKRLPADLVDDVSAQPIQPSENAKKKLKKGNNSQEVSRVHTRFEDEHYIPLTTENAPSQDFKVAILESKKWKNKFSKPSFSAAINFRQQALNSPAIKRESTNTIQQARVKQTLSGKNGLVGF